MANFPLKISVPRYGKDTDLEQEGTESVGGVHEGEKKKMGIRKAEEGSAGTLNPNL
jgi:hypothetical protein